MRFCLGFLCGLGEGRGGRLPEGLYGTTDGEALLD